MDTFNEGLRCQDVHSGLRNVDPNSPILGSLNDTRIVGMAATIAGLVRGRDVIEDAQALMVVAASHLDVNLLAFNEVVGLLEDAGFVQGIQRSGGKIAKFTETVPFYDDLYVRLGDAWRSRAPTELEQQVLLMVDGLAQAPIPLESMVDVLGLDPGALPRIREISEGAGLMQTIHAIDGDIAYSPFFGFENPQLLNDLVVNHGGDQLITEFAAVRARQGLAIRSETYPLLTEAVAGGLLLAPTVTLPNGELQPFASLPYVADPQILTARKPVLDKALAVLACLRCAESFGGHANLSAAGLIDVVDKLLDPNRGFLNPNSAHRRQYALMRNAGLIVFGPDSLPGGRWVTPQFIDTDDNRMALGLARDMLTRGELVEHRVDDNTARAALDGGSAYDAPMQTTYRLRRYVEPSPKEYEKIFEAAMGMRAM